MKIIKPSTEFYGEVPTDYELTLKFIEKCGRLCYKSEDKITEDSTEKFVRKLIKASHLAMVEHSSFVVKTSEIYHLEETQGIVGPFLKVIDNAEGETFIGGNLTAWFNAWSEDPGSSAHDIYEPFLDIYGSLFGIGLAGPAGTKSSWQTCPHDEIPEKLHRYSVKFICDRGVSHELVRHRPCSFAQESTRYVNYKGKDMEFIEPAGFDNWTRRAKFLFRIICTSAEEMYSSMLVEGLKPQQARAILPNALKTEVMVTADLAEWRHIFNLRCSPSAHPDFVRLAVPLRDQFIENGLI